MNQTVKVITLFTGIGSQEAALKRLGISYEVVGISEIDKYAIQSYEAINGITHNYGDITKISALDYADLWTYSFPCQDLSQAGKQAGIKKGTRSGLLLEVERLLTDSVIRGDQPKYLLLENVKALVSKKFKPDFERWLAKLEQLGYNNYWQVLNAKDYGIPQNRERVFVVSIRKDVDINGYKFPEKIPLVKRLKDVLEPVVDEKYYLSDERINSFLLKTELSKLKGNGFAFKPYKPEEKESSFAITTRSGERVDDNFLICASRGRNPDNPSDRTVGAPTEQRLEINSQGISNTLTTVQKDNTVIEPLKISENTKKGYTEGYPYDSVNLEQPNSKTRRGRVGHSVAQTLTCSCNQGVIQLGNIVNSGNWDNPQRGRIDSPSGCSPALNTCQGGGLEPKILQLGNYMPSGHSASKIVSDEGISPTVMENHGTVTAVPCNYRIRKLTPRECWRLMGFTDIEFDCAQISGVSNSQLYKQAGNSIVVNVLVAIFKELFDAKL